MITIPLPKGCILVLTAEEYRRGLARGKAKRRRQAFDQRQARPVATDRTETRADSVSPPVPKRV